jgi:hypothetical protein
MYRQGFLVVVFFIATVLLSGCGGGDGGGGGGQGAAAVVTSAAALDTGNRTVTVTPIRPPANCSASLPASTSSVTVQGNLKYERVDNLAGGALNYSAISAQPVRGATVELMFGCTVVASTQSSATGQYVFTSVPGSTTLSLRVRAELKQTTGAAQWDVSVSDNTNGNAMYALASSNFNSGTGTSVTQNLTAGSGWGGSSYTAARAAAPFAILDVFYQSQQKVLASNPNTIFPPLRAFWSINNSTASGDRTLGNIGSSFFWELTTASGVVRELYILGRQNDDTDEYDSSVVAHEWGHYYQSAFSRDDSMGGHHGGPDDRLDRRIAFSEGWGNAWSGIALAKNNYADSSGPSQASGFILPLNSGYASPASAPSAPKGWFREISLQFILWDLHRQAGFSPIHNALTSSAFKSGTALSDIHSFSAAFRSVASGTPTTALDTLLSAESINTSSDALGNNETNNGGANVALPYYRNITALGAPATLASGQSLCVTAAFDPSNVSNKLGRYVYVTFTTPVAGLRTITVGASASSADPDFEVYSAGRFLGRAEVGTSTQESGSVNLAAGQHVLVIYDYNNVSGNPCFSVSIQ